MTNLFGWDTKGFTRNQSIKNASYELLYITCLTVVYLIGYKISKVYKIYWFPEVGLTIIIGIIAVFIAKSSGHEDIATSFDSDMFFSYLLPPIIFSSGFQQNDRAFREAYTEILLFANLGTLISAIVVGYGMYWLGQINYVTKLSLIECLSFGSMISATDPVSTLAIFAEMRVEPILFAIVLGTSILDDAIAVILFNTFNHFVGKKFDLLYAIITIISYFLINLIGSTVVGCVIGVMFTYIIKLQLKYILNNKMTLICLSFTLIYVSYLVAYIFQLSGIISCLYASMMYKKYLSKVMSKVYIEEIKSFLEIMAYLAESLVFFSIGMSIFNEELYNSYDFNTIAWSFLLCIIGRAAFVYPLSFLLNLRYDNNTIQPIATSSTTSMPIYTTRLEFNAQHMIVFAGLRGPISYAAALIFPDTLGHRGVVVATTRVIMLFTIFIKGGLTAFALSYFDIKRDYSSNSDDGDEILVDNLSSIPSYILRFENYFIIPLFHVRDVELESNGQMIWFNDNHNYEMVTRLRSRSNSFSSTIAHQDAIVKLT